MWTAVLGQIPMRRCAGSAVPRRDMVRENSITNCLLADSGVGGCGVRDLL